MIMYILPGEVRLSRKGHVLRDTLREYSEGLCKLGEML